jgi:beta-lactamase regulating signal transducer with metallopeptidase domain
VNIGQLTLLFVQSTVLLAVAWLGTTVFRTHSLARRTIARSAIVGLFGLLIILPMTGLSNRFFASKPLVEVPTTVELATPIFAPIIPAMKAENIGKPEPAVSTATPSPTTVREASPDGSSVNGEAIIVWVWLAGVIVQMLRLAIGVVMLQRVRRRSTLVSPNSFPPVRQSADISFPFVTGLWRPTVYLPIGLEPEVQAVVQQHEQAHIRNRDLQWSFAARCLTVLFWPQPLIWWLSRSLALATEEQCDAAVVASGLPRERYAAALLDLRTSLSPPTRARSMASGLSLGTINPGSAKRPSTLYRRIESIMKTKATPLHLSSRSRAVVVVGTVAICAATVLAFNRSVPVQTPPDLMEGFITQPYPLKLDITDSQGKPVSGARAWVTVAGEVLEPFELPVSVTGSRLDFAVGPVPKDSIGILAVDAPGLPLYFQRMWPAEEKIRKISLSPPTQTKVRVVLPDGQLAGGLRIGPTMLVDNSKEYSRTEAPAVTVLTPSRTKELGVTISANGLATFDKIPPRTDARLDVSDDRYARLGFEDRFDGTKSGLQIITLRQSAEISGRVTHAGKPVAGITIGVQDNNENYSIRTGSQDIFGSAVSDSDGNYTIRRLGTGLVNVIFDERFAKNRQLTAVAHEGIQTKPGVTVQNVDFALVPGGIIEGRVTDSAGKPIPNTSVGIYGPAHPRSSAWVQFANTDAKGRYQVRVPAGKNYVYCMDSRYSQSGFDVTVKDGKSITQNFVLTPNLNPGR